MKNALQRMRNFHSSMIEGAGGGAEPRSLYCHPTVPLLQRLSTGYPPQGTNHPSARVHFRTRSFITCAGLARHITVDTSCVSLS